MKPVTAERLFYVLVAMGRVPPCSWTYWQHSVDEEEYARLDADALQELAGWINQYVGLSEK